MFLRKWLIEGFLMLCFCIVVILKIISSVFFAGLLTILLYFLALILYVFTLRPEDAECAGHNSGSYLGEQLVTIDNFLPFFQLLFPGATVSTLLLGVICIQISLLCMTNA